MDGTEAEIIRACQRGEPERFAELYDAYAERIYRFLYYKTMHRETAEDLMSQVFLKALARIGSMDPERPFSAWIYGIAKHAVIDHYRTSHPATNIEDVWDLSDGKDLVADVEKRLQIESIRQELAKLTNDQREVVMLRVWEDLSYAEIAAITGKSEANCRMLFSRSVAELKSLTILSLLILLIS